MKDTGKKSGKNHHAVDRSADLISAARQGVGRAKDQVENLTNDRQPTPEGYAQDNVKYASENIARDTAHMSKEAAKKVYDGGKKLAEQIKQK